MALNEMTFIRTCHLPYSMRETLDPGVSPLIIIYSSFLPSFRHHVGIINLLEMIEYSIGPLESRASLLML